MPATLLKAETLPCRYVNLANNFLFSIDTVPASGSSPPTGTETLDPTQATRVQIFFSDGAALLGNIPAGSTLKMFSTTDHTTPLAVWVVQLFTASFFNSYPVALQVLTPPASAAPVVPETNYYFELWSPDGSTPPPPPPPPPPQPQQVLLLGDSITLQGGNSFQPVFPGKTLVNLGINGYKSGQLLSQIQGGGLASYTNVTDVVLNIGTNDLPDATTVEEIVSNITTIVSELRSRLPSATIALTLIFPRYDTAYFADDPQTRNVKRSTINTAIATAADGQHVKLVDVTADPAFATPPYTAFQSDLLHLVGTGYSVWTAATTAALAAPAPDILATIHTSTPSTPSSSNVTPTVSQIIEVIVNGGTPSQETVSLGASRSLPVHTGDVLKVRWKDVNSVGPSDVWSDTLTVVASVPASGLPGKAGVGSVTFSPL